MANVVASIFGTATMSPDVVGYLDNQGNKNGVYDLGDVLAYLDRTRQRLSQSLMTQVLSALAENADLSTRAMPKHLPEKTGKKE